MVIALFVFLFQAEDGIRDDLVTGVQTCALPIFPRPRQGDARAARPRCRRAARASPCRGRGTPSRGCGPRREWRAAAFPRAREGRAGEERRAMGAPAD